MAQALLRGTIRDEATGGTVAGARVRAVAEGSRAVGPLATTETDEHGAFSLGIVWPDDGDATVHLDACSAAHATTEWRSWHDDPPRRVSSRDVVVQDLALKAGFALMLDLDDDQGRPVEGATIDVIQNNFVADCCSWPLRLHPRVPARLLLPRSDAAGRVEVPGLGDLPPGWRYVVSITHPDLAEATLDLSKSVGREGGVLRARVTLLPGHAIEGLLRGEHVAQGKVVASLDAPGIPGCHAIARFAVVDASGAFRITGLHPGTHTLQVSAPGAATKVLSIRVPSLDPVTIELVPCRRIRGRVIGEDGEAVARSQVLAEWPGDYGRCSVEADDRGSFSLDVPADQRIVVAALRNAPIACEGLGVAVLAPGREDVDVTFDAHERGKWTGRLHDDRSGEPVDGDVMVVGELRGTSFHFGGKGDWGNGCFELRLPPGEYALAFQAMRAHEHTHAGYIEHVDISPRVARDDVRIAVAAGFLVAVSVLDGTTNAPVNGAALEGRLPGIWSRIYLGHTGQDGFFSIEPAIEGPMHIRVGATGFRQYSAGWVDIRRGMAPIVVRLERAAADDAVAPAVLP